MAVPANQQALFSSLVERFGLNAALALLPLLNQDSSTAAKAFSGASLAGTGARAAGAASGTPALSTLGKGVGTGLGLASGAYGAYQAATDPNLSKTKQIGHSGRAVADTLMGILIPYYGIAKAASIVGQVLSRSGSPQVAGAGRAIDQAAEPSGAKAFWNVAQGDLSPKAAAKRAGPEGLITDLLGPVGAILKGVGVDKKVAGNIMDYGPIPFAGKGLGMLGIGSKPTTGTMFRDELAKLMNQIPALKGTSTSAYNAPAGGYGSFDPKAVTAAQQLGASLAGRTADASKNPAAYNLQAENILLSRFGNQLPAILASVIGR